MVRFADDEVIKLKDQLDTLRRELHTLFERLFWSTDFEAGFNAGRNNLPRIEGGYEPCSDEYNDYHEGYDAGTNVRRFINGEIP